MRTKGEVMKSRRSFVGSMIVGVAAMAMSVVGAQSAAKTAKIGEAAPAFTLKDLAGKEHSLASFKDKVLVIEWFNPGCPYCRAVYEKGEVQKILAEMKTMGDNYAYIAINSTGNKAEADVIAESKAFLAQHKVEIPCLIDHNGAVGRSYEAKTTPHMYVIDGKGVLRYMGAIDDQPNTDTSKIATARNYVREAFAAVKAGKQVEATATDPYGCSVKYP